MPTMLERLRAGHVLVGDGAWGTLLMARGLPTGAPPERVNLEQPELLESIAREYVQAGADLLTTNTFGASPIRLAAHGLAAQLAAIVGAAVERARRACGPTTLIAGAIGPSGRRMDSARAGSAAADALELAASFSIQASALVRAGVDLFCVETMTDLVEARLAVTAARSAAPALPIMATMTFASTAAGVRTLAGDSVEVVQRGLAEAGADIIGCNCGDGLRTALKTAHAFRAAGCPRPLAVRPSAGLPAFRDGSWVYPDTPERFTAAAVTLLSDGVQIIGGCCGTTPAHVAALRAVVDARKLGA